MKKFLSGLFVCAGFILNGAQAQDAAPQYSATLQTLAQNEKATYWVNGVYGEMLRRYDAAVAETEALQSTLKVGCWTKDQAAQTAWLRAYQSWVAATSLVVGDETTASALRQIYFRPTRVSLIDEAIAQGAGRNATVATDEIGVAAKGLAALEYVLYTGAKTPERCAYANWLANELVVGAQQLNRATQTLVVQRQEALKNPSTRVPATAQSIEEFTNIFIGKTSEVLGRDLIKLSVIKKDAVLSPYAGQSKAILQAQLRAWQDLLIGRAGREGGWGYGFVDYLNNDAKQTKLAQDLQHKVAVAMRAVDQLPANFAPLAQKQPLPKNVNAAIDALQDVQLLLESDVADALGVAVSFNDADGD